MVKQLEFAKPILVDAGDDSYPIYVGSNLVNNLNLLADHIQGKQVLVITSSNLNFIAAPILNALEDSQQYDLVEELIIPDGDDNKTLDTANLIWQTLIEHGFYRDCVLIAVGGGVIGDMVGFAAACYMRGVDWLNVPTTLLAQVDAAIGGKTAVNHPQGKNMIGAFHAPKAVFSDVHSLDTLPEEEFLAGLAEVIKYGIGLDQSFFQWLDQHIDLILNREPEILLQMVQKCSSIKAQVVTEDFKEKGQRALLNFGHTVGHAVETSLNYQIRHGYAVSIGMAVALRCSLDFGLKPQDYEKAIDLLTRFGLPTKIPNQLEAKTLLACMAKDKKNLSDAPMRMILLSSLGGSKCVTQMTPDKVREVLLYFGAR